MTALPRRPILVDPRPSGLNVRDMRVSPEQQIDMTMAVGKFEARPSASRASRRDVELVIECDRESFAGVKVRVEVVDGSVVVKLNAHAPNDTATADGEQQS